MINPRMRVSQGLHDFDQRPSVIRAIPYTSLWFGLIIWVLIGGALLIGTGYMLYQDFLFTAYAQPAQGTVERKFYKISHGRHGSTNYTACLDYRYQLPGMIIHCDSSVQNDTFSRVNVGGPIPVDYIPGEPTDNRIELPGEIRQVRILTFLLVAGSLLVSIGGAFVLRYYLRQNKINRALWVSGTACEGVVTEMPFDVVGKGRTQRYYLLFTFRDDQDREISGRTWYIQQGYEYLWSVRSPIRVLYDPRDPKTFTVDLNSGPLRT